MSSDGHDVKRPLRHERRGLATPAASLGGASLCRPPGNDCASARFDARICLVTANNWKIRGSRTQSKTLVP